MKEFVIPFSGLKTGKHEFKFKIDHTFFEAFDQALLEDADLDVDLVLEKVETMLILNLHAKGYTKVPCDRCGDLFNMPIECSERVIVKFGDEEFEQTDEIIVLRPEDYEIDISQRVYEMIVLNLPNKRIHKNPADCNQEVLEKLNEINSPEDDIDPRWEALKKLK
jgi:uncharacterized metal-binding protein YceD (DUF177 family)